MAERRDVDVLMFQSWALGAWAATTALIDFLAVPTVFRALASVEGGVLVGGGIGASLFSAYNWAELILGLLFVAGLFLRRVHYRVLLMALGLVLLGIVLTYVVYLVPGIKDAFELMRAPEVGEAAQTYAQEKMEPLHRTYIVLDSIKLLLLFIGGAALFADARALALSGRNA